jgi:dTDP-4-amino-4,6-dideoxygalactose transaminase
MISIPFSKPYVPHGTLDYVQEVFQSSTQQGGGDLTKLAKNEISKMYPGSEVFLTPSCTAALELSLMLLDIGPGDEVIVPSFTFTSAAIAITKFWATPVFCDISLVNGCINLIGIESLITSKTRAITWVNYGGNIPNVLEIKRIAKKYGIATIEDSAHSFGVNHYTNIDFQADFVTFSFHASKNIQCGEGGALLVNTKKCIERAYVLQEKGTNRRAFDLGLTAKYRWVDRGSSYLMAEVNAAVLLKQLFHFNDIQQTRRAYIDKYTRLLTNELPDNWQILDQTHQAGHMFALLAPSKDTRKDLITKARNENIGIVSHYEDLSTSPAGLRFGKKDIQKCENSIDFSERIARLPIFYELNENCDIVVEFIINGVSRF